MMTTNKLPKFPLESIKALDDYLNEIVVLRSITSENLPVDIYYGLRNMSYNIIEILDVLDKRADDQTKTEAPKT